MKNIIDLLNFNFRFLLRVMLMKSLTYENDISLPFLLRIKQLLRNYETRYINSNVVIVLRYFPLHNYQARLKSLKYVLYINV